MILGYAMALGAAEVLIVAGVSVVGGVVAWLAKRSGTDS